MANQPLLFGDKITADVRLHLIDSDGVEYPENPLLLHSQVLKNAEFFETKLSERWSSDKRPFEIKVTSSYHPENYIKCIELMYSYDTDQRFNFSNVDEVLAILPVVSEVMFRDCMESCMRYMDAVRWSPEQEAKLRILLSSLHINILPDLAARLGMSQSKSECRHIEILKECLQELLSMVSNGHSSYRSTVEKHMLDYFESNTSPAVKDACRYAILKEFNAKVDKIKSKSDARSACSTLSWLVGVMRIRDAKLFETVVKLFCEDADLRNAIACPELQNYSSACDVLTILIDHVLKAMGNGEIITPMSYRVDFLTQWANTIVNLINCLPVPTYLYGYDPDNTRPTFQNALLRGITDVGETLPLVEQTRIYNSWKDTFSKDHVLQWWVEKVHDAIIVHNII